MMFPLASHPAHPPSLPMAVEASAVLSSDNAVVFTFRCRYEADARRAVEIALPAPMCATECDNLWQHTCLEAFVSVPDAKDYLEFNFSPSSCWAAYRFEDYRLRDEAFAVSSAPEIEMKRHEYGFELTAKVSSTVFSTQWPQSRAWLIGLTAVIETTDGQKSYWAMRHDADQPDFHLRAQFLLPLHF